MQVEKADLEDTDLVVGLLIGVSRVYPVRLLSLHEVVNDRVGDRYPDTRVLSAESLGYDGDLPDPYVACFSSGAAGLSGAGWIDSRLSAQLVYWFAWTDFYPESNLY